MKSDPLETVLRLRRLAEADALRCVAECVERQARAEAALARVEQSIQSEQRAAEALEGDDLAVETFGHWFRVARRERRNAEAALAHAEAETARARAALAAIRAEREVAEIEAARRASAQRAEALKAEQTSLDEAARQSLTKGLSG